MLPEEIEIGKVYRIFGTTLYVGRVEKFDGIKARMTMITGRMLTVPWYNIVSPANVGKEEYEKNAEKIHEEQQTYLWVLK